MRSSRKEGSAEAPGGTRRTVFVLLWLAAAALLSCSRTGAEIPGNLLGGRQPTKAVDVTEPVRLTDGVTAEPGDNWESDLTSVFKGGAATVEWDLGRVAQVRAVYLQGDNNDEFFIAGSEDGTNFTDVYTARTVRSVGMQPRFANELDAKVRYLRLTARGGDPAVSVGEIAVFETVPAVWPPRFASYAGGRPKLPGENETFLFGVIASLFLLLHSSSWPSWTRVFGVVLTLFFGYSALDAVTTSWPPGQPVIDMTRAMTAVVAAAAAIRVVWRQETALPRLITSTLVAMAFLAMTTFYNMWQPQFDDVDHRGKTWVHTWDMRVYFPTAKYFDELGFDGVYLASVAAYAEETSGGNLDRLGRTELRDLRTYDMTTVTAVADQIRTVSKRFTEARWNEFKRDMSYFWRTMGPGGYLGSLRDHGGNATPSWIFVAYLLLGHSPATEHSLSLLALLDPLLLFGFFLVAERIFGLIPALVCLVVYGTNTFPWFGSNWAGSTLRNDWMVLVGLGACALKRERFALGGALLAWGAMIRAFPAMSVFFLVVPALWWMWDVREKEGKLPTLRRFAAEHRALLRTLAGVAAAVLILFLVPGLRFGFSHAWGDWTHKISLHASQPNVNHVGLRTLFQFDPSRTLRALATTGGDWSELQVRTLMARRPAYFVTMAGISVLALAAARGRDLRQASLLGMMLIPVYFYASNYYLHYIFILPLLVDYPTSGEKRDRWLWGIVVTVLLAISASEYWGFDAQGVDERYAQWSWGVLIGYVVIFAALARDAWPELGRAKSGA